MFKVKEKKSSVNVEFQFRINSGELETTATRFIPDFFEKKKTLSLIFFKQSGTYPCLKLGKL